MNIQNSGEIFKLIPKIMGDVGSIPKTRRGAGAINYAFRGIDDLYLSLQQPLVKHGVFFVPEVIEERHEERQSKSGGLLIYSILRSRFTFYAPDGSSVTATTVGEAMDSSDKASNKAMSAALKYALLQIFCIPTEEEKDSEHQDHQATPKTLSNAVLSHARPPTVAASVGSISEAQAVRLWTIAKKSFWTQVQVKDYMKTLGLNTEMSLNQVQYKHFCELMEKYPKVKE